MRYDRTGIGARVDLDPSFDGFPDGLPPTRVEGHHVVCEHRVFVTPWLRILGEPVQVDDGGHQRSTILSHLLDHVVAHAGAVLNAVNPGGHELRHRLLPETVSRHPGAFLVRDCDRFGGQISWE